jgi:hypothetical protein
LIKELLVEAATSEHSEFKFIEETDGFNFYSKLIGDNKRFLVFYETTSLENVNFYNDTIQDIVPSEIASESSFEHNSDLIILLKIKNLSDFNNYEQQILSIEEDPYSFKKYVLYYSEEEEKLVANKHLKDLEKTILDRNLFKAYKENPIYPSIYSFSARFFIKIPFLRVPVNEEAMSSVEVMLTESLIDNNLEEFDKKLTLAIERRNGDHAIILKEYEDE